MNENIDIQKRKLKFIEQIRIALSKPLWYKSLLQQSIGKHICYFLILLILITVIRFVIPCTAYLQSVGGLKNLIYNGIPGFSFENGVLQVDTPVDIEQNGVRIIIDTSVDAYTVEDAQSKAAEMGDSMNIVYMISRTNAVNNISSVTYDLSLMNGITINNDVVYQAAPIYLIFYGIFSFIGNIIAYLISALFFALFGYLMNRALKLNLKFGQIYVIALYAKSVEILLEAVLEVVGISLLYYVGSIIGIFITCNYMTRGMSSMLIPRSGDSDQGQDRRFF